MTIKNRALLRLLLMGLLLVSAVTAGYLWGQHTETAYLAAVVTTLSAMLSVLAVENIASSAETQLSVVLALLRKTVADDVIADEKARRLNLIVGMLEAQNDQFRLNILTNKVHEMDDMRRAALEVPISRSKDSVA